MKKLVRLLLVVALSGFASWASAGGWIYPTCASLDGFDCEDGRLVCDNGNGTTGACYCSGVWECHT